MIATVEQLASHLVAVHRQGRPLLLLMDYDGTLVPLADRPEAARLSTALRTLLQQLAQVPRLAVGILSGRMLEDVRACVGLTELYFAGSSGLELDLRGDCRPVRVAAEFARIKEELTYRLTIFLRSWPGIWLECKRYGWTVHDRNGATEVVRQLRSRAREVLGQWNHLLCIHEGHSGLEILPAGAGSKGTALRTILAQTDPTALAFYAGDDMNDCDALLAATALGGIAVGIGPHAPAVTPFTLPGPQELEALLRNVHQGLAAGGTC